MCSISLGEDLELECITIGANPPAKLRWFLGEQEIHTGHRQENSRGKTNAEIVDESKARTWTSISRLTLPVSKADNNAILRCLAEHPALLAGETLVSSKFLTIHCKFQQEILSAQGILSYKWVQTTGYVTGYSNCLTITFYFLLNILSYELDIYF